MWKLGRALVLLGYFVPLVWLGWIVTTPPKAGGGSLGDGILLMFQLGAVVSLSLGSLTLGTLFAAVGWRRGTGIKARTAYLVVGAGSIGAAALVGVLFWLQLTTGS